MDSHDLSKRVTSEDTHTGGITNFDNVSENDDDEDNNSDSGQSDDKEAPKKHLLVSSASVPMFTQSKDVAGDIGSKPPSEYGGSETDLSRVDVNQTALQLSQSYAGPDRGHHKVQFVENSSHHVSFSPIRKTKSRSPSFEGKSPSKKKRRNRTMSENSTASKTLSLGSSVTSVSTNTESVYVAPDGGFGWVVVAASFFVNMIADGVTFSFAIMFEELQTEFDSSAAVTAGVVSMFHAVPLLTGPIATWLTDKFGCRAVTIWGSILASIGFLAASFSHHIALLYIFFGVVSGFGLSLCYVASIIIVAYYFESKRSFATGIAVCGSGIGTFLFAPFTQWLMDNYDGWRGACIILSAIFLNMIVCGLMFRELQWNKKKMSRASSARSIISQMPEIEELRQALENGNVSELIKDKEEEVMIASSLITIPTYIKDPSKLPEDVLSSMLQNKQTYDFILENYPEALKDIHSVESLIVKNEVKENHVIDTKTSKTDSESTSVKLKRRVSSLIKGQKSILKKNEHKDVEVNQVPTRRNLEKLKAETESLKVRRQSMTYRGTRVGGPRVTTHVRSSSCPDIYKNTVMEDSQEQETFYSELLHSFRDCLSLHYVTLPFVAFCISNFLLYFWYDVPYVYTIEYVENDLKIPNTKSTQILSIIGILNTVGEVGVGWLSDQEWVSSITLYSVCMCICGLVTAIIPLVSSYPLILALSAAYGFCISANYSLTSPILVDLVSIQQFSAAYGLLLACQGIANLVGPPFAGWLYDLSSKWFLTFGLCGLFIAISGISLLIIPAVNLFRNSFFELNKCKSKKKCNGTDECKDRKSLPVDV